MSPKYHTWFALTALIVNPVAAWGQLSAYVFDLLSNRPVSAAALILRQENEVILESETDSDGRATFTELQPGLYRLHITKPGYVDLLDLQGRGRLGSLSGTASVGVTRTAAIAGQAVDAQGRPLQGAAVLALVRRSFNGETRFVSWGQPARTDDHGMYRVYGLPPGHYSVAVISSPDQGPADASASAFYGSTELARAVFFELQAGETRTAVNLLSSGIADRSRPEDELKIAFAPGPFEKLPERKAQPARAAGEISGALIDPEGQPVRGVVVLSVAEGQGDVEMTEAGADGGFRFTGVPSGRYRLAAMERLISADYLDPVEAPTVVTVEPGKRTAVRLVRK